MLRSLALFASGLLFALGLGLSGMTRPAKVLAFLDVTGAWDPSLAFVMIGAIGVHLTASRLYILKRVSPLWAEAFALPAKGKIDRRLLAGAAIFGVGWGLGGMCPGPAITDLASFAWQPIAFVGAMLAGMAAVRAIPGARPTAGCDLDE